MHADPRLRAPLGERSPYAPGTEWPARVDTRLADGVAEDEAERWVPSASLLHSNGDAMDIAVRDGRIVGVRGPGERSGQPRSAAAVQAQRGACRTGGGRAMTGTRLEYALHRVHRECHPQTLRQIRWANGMIKALSPQALASLDT